MERTCLSGTQRLFLKTGFPLVYAQTAGLCRILAIGTFKSNGTHNPWEMSIALRIEGASSPQVLSDASYAENEHSSNGSSGSRCMNSSEQALSSYCSFAGLHLALLQARSSGSGPSPAGTPTRTPCYLLSYARTTSTWVKTSTVAVTVRASIAGQSGITDIETPHDTETGKVSRGSS